MQHKAYTVEANSLLVFPLEILLHVASFLNMRDRAVLAGTSSVSLRLLDDKWLWPVNGSFLSILLDAAISNRLRYVQARMLMAPSVPVQAKELLIVQRGDNVCMCDAGYNYRQPAKVYNDIRKYLDVEEYWETAILLEDGKPTAVNETQRSQYAYFSPKGKQRVSGPPCNEPWRLAIENGKYVDFGVCDRIFEMVEGIELKQAIPLLEWANTTYPPAFSGAYRAALRKGEMVYMKSHRGATWLGGLELCEVEKVPHIPCMARIRKNQIYCSKKELESALDLVENRSLGTVYFNFVQYANATLRHMEERERYKNEVAITGYPAI